MKKILPLLFFIVLIINCVSAQNYLTGIVKNPNGEPLVGANVFVKGTTQSTLTGINGEFRIVADTNAVLLITYKGYKDFEVKANRLTITELKMYSADEMDFYGNDDYYYLLTANTLIKSDDYAVGTENNLYQLLRGKVAGLNIISYDGRTDAASYYILRGDLSDVSYYKMPMVIVDGVYSTYSLFMLNPNNIESIRVVREPISLGINDYNLAIVVKTRKPTEKSLSVQYSGSVSINTDANVKNDDYNDYSTTTSTQHNLQLLGNAGKMPYRLSFNYNLLKGMLNDETEHYAADFWLNPKVGNFIDVSISGYYKRYSIAEEQAVYNYYTDTKAKTNFYGGNIGINHTVQGAEDFYINILSSVEYLDEDNIDEDNDALTATFDANLLYSHKFNTKHYVEAKVGTIVIYDKYEGNSYLDSEWKETQTKLYVQSNLAANKFFTNAKVFINNKLEYLQASLSLGLKPINQLTLRMSGSGTNIYLGNDNEWDRYNDDYLYDMTASGNFGIDWNVLKNRLFGSFDVYFNRTYEYNDGDKSKINNLGVDFQIGSKILDMEHIKWRVNANAAYNKSYVGNVPTDEDRLAYLDYDDMGRIEGKSPITYTALEQVYDVLGNPISGLFNDIDGDGEITSNDCVVRHSPLPSVIGGFSTYFEAYDAYLQLNAHANINRYNYIYDYESYPITGNVKNSSFLRIDDITLGYKFRWARVPWQVYASVQNPFVVTDYDGIEPEILNGFEGRGYYQRPTIFAFGVKIGFNSKN